MITTFLNIIAWLEKRELPCLFKKYLHVDCPGCGFQRSFIALFKGNIKESFLLFPTTFALILFFILFFTNNKYEFVSMKKFLNAGLVLLFTFFTLTYLYKIL